MKYVTYVIVVEAGTIDTADPFTLVLPSVRGSIMEEFTLAHSTRLEALTRQQFHNTKAKLSPGPVLWMLAIEVDAISLPDIEAVWLQSEGGTLEATIGMAFRFISPTLEEEELLRMGRLVCLN